MEPSQSALKDLSSRWVDPSRLPRVFRIFADTSDFYRVDYDDVVILDDHPYLIRNNEREGRFGIDEQQKFWVKRAIDLADGTRKIIKLVFHERFVAHVGPLSFACARSPVKEARVLEKVTGHGHFMQGRSVRDTANNLVRIIDYIYGKRLSEHIARRNGRHEHYFFRDFPGMLQRYTEAVDAIRFLHENGEIHGDIRRDHLIVDREDGRYRWIDFDFTYAHTENRFGYDLFGLGNILIYLAGGGDVITHDLSAQLPHIYERIGRDDLNIIFHNRIANLKKVYPYIPEELNFVLLHFAQGAETFYEDTRHFLDDVRRAQEALRSP